VIDDHAIANLEATAARPGSDDLTRGLVAGDDTLVAFRTFAQVLVIDGANVRTADGGSFDREKHLTVTGLRYRHVSQLDGTVPREKRSFHRLAHWI
jgi:hypothetical protein